MADRKLSATISIGGSVSSSLGKAFGSVSKGAKGIGAELKAISQQTKELEKMVKELKAAGKSTGDLEKKLAGLYRQQAKLRGQSGRLGAVGHMFSSGGGLNFGATTSAILQKMVKSEAFGEGTVAALMGAEAALPIIGEVAMAVTVLVGVAVAGAAAIFALGKSVGDFIDGVSDTADGLGMATNNLMGLQYAAAQSGIDADKLTDKLTKMTNALESAKGGTGPAADALAELGLTWQELSVMNPEEQVVALAEAFKQYNGNIPKVNLATAFFGKGAGKFVNMLNQGRDGLRAQMRDAREVGYMVTKDQEELAGRFDKAWQTTLISFKAAWLQIGTAVLPVVNEYLEQIVAWFKDPASQKAIKDFAKDFGTMVKSLADLMPSVMAMMNGILKATNGVINAVTLIHGVGIDRTALGVVTGNPTMVSDGMTRMAIASGVDKLPARAAAAATGLFVTATTPSRAAQVSGPTPGNPTAGGLRPDGSNMRGISPAAPPLISNTYHFTVNGASGQNANDLMEQIRRYLRDTQPQTVGGF